MKEEVNLNLVTIKSLKKDMYNVLGELLLESIHQEKKYLDIDDYIKEKRSFKIKDLEEDNNE